MRPKAVCIVHSSVFLKQSDLLKFPLIFDNDNPFEIATYYFGDNGHDDHLIIFTLLSNIMIPEVYLPRNCRNPFK